MPTHCVGLAILADYLGSPAVAVLVQHFGGQTLKVPRRAAGKTWARLCDALGDSLAHTLIDNFGGEALYIAINHRQFVAWRRERAAALRAQGMSYAQIARALPSPVAYTERGVRKMIAGQRADARQLSLLLE